MKAIEFSNVDAGYHGNVVIDGLDLAIEDGEMAAILGPNGAGKTTLLRCIIGLCRPTAGSVSLFGKNIASLSAAERARLVAVVPQEMETPMPFTVEEIVMIGRTASLNRWSGPSRKDHTAVERAMVYTDVTDLKNRSFTELSGGEKQRAMVAMALAAEPRIILMDEATSHLDLNHRLEVMQIVERLNREQHVTILMISHDLNLSAEFCRRIVMLDHGKIVADGKPADVLSEEILRKVYHCEVVVQQNPANGSVCVIPAPRLTPGLSGKGIKVHVVAGGGCGEEVLRRLSLCEYTVTCGVLNQGDSDADVCRALDIETVLEKPFSPLSSQAIESASSMALKADIVVICGVPFGPGNTGNLDVAAKALSAGKKVFLMHGTKDRDYTPDKAASSKADQLAQKGAVSWQSITDLLKLLS